MRWLCGLFSPQNRSIQIRDLKRFSFVWKYAAKVCVRHRALQIRLILLGISRNVLIFIRCPLVKNTTVNLLYSSSALNFTSRLLLIRLFSFGKFSWLRWINYVQKEIYAFSNAWQLLTDRIAKMGYYTDICQLTNYKFQIHIFST